jgi:hypothetical protein
VSQGADRTNATSIPGQGWTGSPGPGVPQNPEPVARQLATEIAGIAREALDGTGLQCWSQGQDELAGVALLSALGSAMVAVALDAAMADTTDVDGALLGKTLADLLGQSWSVDLTGFTVMRGGGVASALTQPWTFVVS